MCVASLMSLSCVLCHSAVIEADVCVNADEHRLRRVTRRTGATGADLEQEGKGYTPVPSHGCECCIVGVCVIGSVSSFREDKLCSFVLLCHKNYKVVLSPSRGMSQWRGFTV